MNPKWAPIREAVELLTGDTMSAVFWSMIKLSLMTPREALELIKKSLSETKAEQKVLPEDQVERADRIMEQINHPLFLEFIRYKLGE